MVFVPVYRKDFLSSFMRQMRISSVFKRRRCRKDRFASVYREFKDANTFMDELKKFLR